MQFFSVKDNTTPHYRNFVSPHLCHRMHYHSKAKTVYKVLFGLAYIKNSNNHHHTWDFWDLGIKQYTCPDVKS